MALSSNGSGYEIFTLVMLGSIPTRVAISLCSSRNRASSVEDEDVGVKPTGGSMTNARIGLHFMRKIRCGSTPL